MDLLAYAQIDDLGEIARRNGIEVPRLRGYRLMKDEEPVDWKEWAPDNPEAYWARWMCTQFPAWDMKSHCSCYCYETDRRIEWYITKDEKVRWDRIHGKKRRDLKTLIKNRTNRYKRQAEVWNKYAGRDDVLYIHARIGGDNWGYFKCESLVREPWFLEKVDDAFDCTYCDIYAKIDVVK